MKFSGKVGNVDGRFACQTATESAAVFIKHWRCILRQHGGGQIMRNETKASFLGQTADASKFFCPAQTYCVVEDGVDYGLQVVW